MYIQCVTHIHTPPHTQGPAHRVLPLIQHHIETACVFFPQKLQSQEEQIQNRLASLAVNGYVLARPQGRTTREEATQEPNDTLRWKRRNMSPTLRDANTVTSSAENGMNLSLSAGNIDWNPRGTGERVVRMSERDYQDLYSRWRAANEEHVTGMRSDTDWLKHAVEKGKDRPTELEQNTLRRKAAMKLQKKFQVTCVCVCVCVCVVFVSMCMCVCVSTFWRRRGT
jgi:hypothetical protein